ncbi:MAG: ROK family protein [Acidimicrobiia bacterium]|nr:ROK family protein [Acidimicrobiia bacterium]
MSLLAPLVAGFDIGGTNVRGVLVDRAGHLVGADRLPRPHEPDGIVDSVVTLVARMGTDAGADAHAVGVGCAGTVDRRGVVRASPNIPTLIEFPLADTLSKRLAMPVIVDNDATTATWAEVKTGAARGIRDVVFVALGTGIGVGIVLDGELRRGAQGFAGEAGHMVISPEGPECVCGRRGCWEVFASGRALGRLTQDAAREHRVPAIVEIAGGVIDDIRGEHVSELVAEGHPEALMMLDELGWWVGLGLTNLVNVLDVSTAVIGGGLSEIGRPLIAAIRVGYNSLMHDSDHRPPLNIVGALHGGRAGAIGAALLAADELHQPSRI